MKLFYSGALQKDQPQPVSELSLGGFISSTPILNSNLNNIFGNQYIPQNYIEQVEYKAIFLKNILSVDCNNVYIYYDYPKTPTDIKLEIGVMTPNSKGEIERISNATSPPLYQNTFSELNGISNKGLVSAQIKAGEYIGLWLKKTYLKKQQDPDKTIYNNWIIISPILTKYQSGVALTEEEQELYDQYMNKVDTLSFFILWD